MIMAFLSAVCGWYRFCLMTLSHQQQNHAEPYLQDIIQGNGIIYKVKSYKYVRCCSLYITPHYQTTIHINLKFMRFLCATLDSRRCRTTGGKACNIQKINSGILVFTCHRGFVLVLNLLPTDAGPCEGGGSAEILQCNLMVAPNALAGPNLVVYRDISDDSSWKLSRFRFTEIV